MMQLDFFNNPVEEEEYTCSDIQCTKCKKYKSPKHFSKGIIEAFENKKPYVRFSGTAGYCKECRAIYSASKAVAIKMAPPRPSLPYACECCDKIITKSSELHFDHDHETGEFRGWICRGCNLGIGAIGDNLPSLEKAIAYLKRASNE